MSTVNRKPKVPIYTNTDELFSLGGRVFAASAGNADPIISGLANEIETARQGMMDENNAMVSLAQQSELKTAARNAFAVTLVDKLRQLRDYGFAKFSPNFLQLSDLGFDVIQSSPTPVEGEVIPTGDPGKEGGTPEAPAI